MTRTAINTDGAELVKFIAKTARDNVRGRFEDAVWDHAAITLTAQEVQDLSETFSQRSYTDDEVEEMLEEARQEGIEVGKCADLVTLNETPEAGTEVWVRAAITVEPARDPHGDVRVVIEDTKDSHYVIDMHREDVLLNRNK